MFLITSCDLFTGPKVDLFQIISDEVDWHNAAKLTVRVEHPNTWGRSNPTGNITPTKDIRKGYAFEIEFTPDLAYSFDGWRAYKTSLLPTNWTTANSEDILAGLESARLSLAGLVEVPTLSSRGGTGSFKINTTEPVTLVPFCKTEPYVTWTTPANSSVTTYPRNTDIVIYFNAPLNFTPGVVLNTLFTSEIIKITESSDNGSIKTKISGNTSAYNAPIYTENIDSGQYKITIKASDVPGERLIEVTVGPDITNRSSDRPMSKAEVFSFRTAPVSVSGTIDTWGASYNGSAITVNWTTSTPLVTVEAHYRVNQGGDNELAVDKIIRGVSQPIDSRVREGENVSNINEYEIFLDLIIEGAKSITGSKSFKIWNIHGMNVSITPTSNNTVLLDNTMSSEQLAMSSGKNFILTQDVTLSGWNPTAIGTFSGKFYGNGHTITINSLGGTAADKGLFGVVNGTSAENPAIVRDLTVVYANMTVTGASATASVGGIAGQATGSTQILNCIVNGANNTATLAVTANAETRLGGIAGYMSDTAYIQNFRAGLNVTLSTSGNNALYVGGVVGNSTSSGTSREITSIGQVSMNKTGGTAYVDIYCGGIAGYLENSNLSDCVFGGKIDIPATFNAYSSSLFIGGLVGDYRIKGLADNCSVTGDIIVKLTGYSTAIYLGGVVGELYGYSDDSRVEITNTSYSNGSVLLDYSGSSSTKRVGGFVGSIMRYSNVNNCHSRATGVTAHPRAGNLLIGGFAGQMAQVNISNCDSSSPVIVPAIDTSAGGVHAGGFSGSLTSLSGTASNITNCFSSGSVNVHCRNAGTLIPDGAGNYIGGLIGCALINGGSAFNTITQCYATGSATAVNHSGNTGLGFSVGGLVGLAISTDISECYATGSVEARKGSGGTMPVIAGGLVGFMGFSSASYSGSPFRMSSIADCYSTGNVAADNPNAANAPVYAGGLAGYVQIDADKAITRSFASGTVSAKNASSGAAAYAGGVVGYKVEGKLEQCVAAGRPGRMVSVSAQGGSSQTVGRVYGYSAGIAPADNYANEALFIGTNASYYAYPLLFTAVIDDSTFLPTPNAADENGLTRTNAQLSIQTTWTNAPLSFSTGAWNFGSVSQGWPVLKNLAGQ